MSSYNERSQSRDMSSSGQRFDQIGNQSTTQSKYHSPYHISYINEFQ